VGCLPRGTDESTQFGATDVDLSIVSFASLESQILQRYCTTCHAEYKSEEGVLRDIVPGNPGASKLYQRVASGSMPRGGPRLKGRALTFIERYINTMNPNSVVLTPLAPSWKSLRVNLTQQYCYKCHNPRYENDHNFEFPRETLTDFDNYEFVREEAEQSLDEMRRKKMPPKKSHLPRPSDEVIDAFEQWIQLGYPQ
jgi:hypothetical protein